MIGATEIERAERTIRVLYREPSVIIQMENLQVDREAFNQWLTSLLDVQANYHRDAMLRMNTRLQASYNTLLMHMFLVGIVAGRNSERVIE